MTERDVLGMDEHPFLATMLASFQSDAFLFFVMKPISGTPPLPIIMYAHVIHVLPFMCWFHVPAVFIHASM